MSSSEEKLEIIEAVLWGSQINDRWWYGEDCWSVSKPTFCPKCEAPGYDPETPCPKCTWLGTGKREEAYDEKMDSWGQYILLFEKNRVLHEGLEILRLENDELKADLGYGIRSITEESGDAE